MGAGRKGQAEETEICSWARPEGARNKAQASGDNADGLSRDCPAPRTLKDNGCGVVQPL